MDTAWVLDRRTILVSVDRGRLPQKDQHFGLVHADEKSWAVAEVARTVGLKMGLPGKHAPYS